MYTWQLVESIDRASEDPSAVDAEPRADPADSRADVTEARASTEGSNGTSARGDSVVVDDPTASEDSAATAEHANGSSNRAAASEDSALVDDPTDSEDSAATAEHANGSSNGAGAVPADAVVVDGPTASEDSAATAEDANGSSNGAGAGHGSATGQAAQVEEDEDEASRTTPLRTPIATGDDVSTRSGSATSVDSKSSQVADTEVPTAREALASLGALSGRRRHRIRRRRSRHGFVVGGTIVLVVAAGAAGLTYAMTRSNDSSLLGSSPYSFASGPLKVLIYPAANSDAVPPDSPVSVVTPNARITAVSLTSSSGTRVNGSRGIGGHSWEAPSGQLMPATNYQMSIGILTADGVHTQRQVSFTTLAPQGVLQPKITPAGGTVGVGETIDVRFNLPVADQASVQSHLIVQESIPVPGAWHWFGNREVHFRPESYWPAGEHVTLLANLANVDAGNDVWGTSNHSVSFTVGDSHVSTVDLNAHNMTVTDNGNVVGNYAISGGRPKYPTMNGVHVVLGKQQDVLMDSQTVGIPRNSPDGYYEHVYYDVAITTGGEYVHSAPWSVGAQGNTNVSHGCVNLAPDNAISFYNFSQPGDIVQVVGSSRPPTDDPGTVDWNMSWDQWLAGSAV